MQIDSYDFIGTHQPQDDRKGKSSSRADLKYDGAHNRTTISG